MSLQRNIRISKDRVKYGYRLTMAQGYSWFLGALATLMVVFAAIGAVRSYSPVPFWDMWNGYLDFYVRATDGDWSVWWGQHNEHRIVLARLFFWLDLRCFAGAGWFLVLINYLLITLVCLTFFFYLRDLVNECGESTVPPVLLYFMTAWLFSWSQENNLIVGFQIQFILAQLLPLCAFYFLHKSVANHTRALTNFSFACFLGILSIGSMANGILTLPLMVLYALISRQHWRRIVLLILLSAITILLYFYGYKSPQAHGSLSATLIDNPIGLLNYTLIYLGGPFHYLFGMGTLGMIAAFIAGCFLLISALFFGIRTLRSPQVLSLQLSLLVFILYIGGSAFGTAGGRLTFGIRTATSSRYMTPTLMAWAALFLLYMPFLLNALKKYRKKTTFVLAAVLVLMLPVQVRALKNRDQEIFEKYVAVLALELGVRDQAQIGKVFPFIDWGLSLAKQPSALNLSVFGMSPIKDAKELIGTQRNFSVTTTCVGNLDEIAAIESENRYALVRGWIFNRKQRSTPKAVYLVNEQDKIVGYALTGMARPDVAKTIDRHAGKSGFMGYILRDALGSSIMIKDSDNNYGFTIIAPRILYQTTRLEPSATICTVSTRNIIREDGWSGSDFDKSRFKNMRVMGSLITSDVNTGTISLMLRRGDCFFYRSGPTGGRQFAEINGTSTALQTATDWIKIDINDKSLPDQFTVKLSDKGDNWGEWSAIAVKNN